MIHPSASPHISLPAWAAAFPARAQARFRRGQVRRAKQRRGRRATQTTLFLSIDNLGSRGIVFLSGLITNQSEFCFFCDLVRPMTDTRARPEYVSPGDGLPAAVAGTCSPRVNCLPLVGMEVS